MKQYSTTNGNRYNFDKENHIHTLDDKPLMGTSTILGVLAKPLTWWASRLATEHLGRPPHKDGNKYIPLKTRLEDENLQQKYDAIMQMDKETYLAVLDEAYKAHNVKLESSATVGTDMHAQLEDYVNNCIGFAEGVPQIPDETAEWQVNLFAKWAIENVGKFLYSEAHCYSETLWTGGIVDLVFEDNYGDIHLLDFKSAKEAYLEHYLQNAGYDIALSENGIFTPDGVHVADLPKPIVAYWSLPFGMKEPSPQIGGSDCDAYKAGFTSALYLYKLKQGFI